MLESGSIQGSEATAKHRSHAPFARGHLEAAVQCPALSATVEVAHTTSRFPYLAEPPIKLFLYFAEAGGACRAANPHGERARWSIADVNDAPGYAQRERERERNSLVHSASIGL